MGNRVRVKVVKNKIAPPFKEAEFDIMFGKGISREGDILDLAVKENIVEKSGAWFAYSGAKIGQGRENAKIYLTENPAVCAEVEAKVRAKYELPGAETEEEPAPKKAVESGRGSAKLRRTARKTGPEQERILRKLLNRYDGHGHHPCR